MSKQVLRDRCGIYTITNGITGQQYIGSSKNIGNRWGQHKYRLERNKHSNPYLQNAWNKYGKSGFVCNILEECTSENLRVREETYIIALTKFEKYNFSNDYGGRPPDNTQNEHARKIWSENAKRRVREGTLGNKPKPVTATNVLTGEIRTYDSQADAEKDGLDQRSISLCCLGKKASHKGWRWAFTDGSSPDNKCKTYISSPEIVRIGSEGNRKVYKGRQAILADGFDSNRVRQCCKGERGRRSHKGYKWEFSDPETKAFYADKHYDRTADIHKKAVVRMDAEGRIIKRYTSQAEAKEDGFDQRKVSACCLGKRKTHGGFSWRYA